MNSSKTLTVTNVPDYVYKNIKILKPFNMYPVDQFNITNFKCLNCKMNVLHSLRKFNITS